MAKFKQIKSNTLGSRDEEMEIHVKMQRYKDLGILRDI